MVTSSFFIDTNIFLELEFQDSRWEDCRDFMKKVETGDLTAATSDFVLYSAILEIESKSGKKESEAKIATFLGAISSFSGLSILRPSYKEMINAAEKMSERRLDFDDSYVVSSMIAAKIDRLVSFDKHYNKVDEIARIEPAELLAR
jgi:predicted nucleic acid-binding protein